MRAPVIRAAPFLAAAAALFAACATAPAEAVPAVVEPQLIGLVELPGLFGVPDPAGPPGSRLPSEHRPVPLHARPDAASPVIARVSSGDSLRRDELSEGVPVARAYGRTAEWVLVALKEGDARYGWVPPDHAGALHDLGTLLKEGLSYLTRDWDGLLRDAPSLAAATREARPPGTAEPMDINVVRVVESEGTTWLHIEVLGPGRCTTRRGGPVLATGWVPALGEPDVPNAWFYSRGC